MAGLHSVQFIVTSNSIEVHSRSVDAFGLEGVTVVTSCNQGRYILM